MEEATEIDTLELWEGALALASILDRMAEGTTIDRDRLRDELGACGADPERVLCAMVESGLFMEVWSKTDHPDKPKRELALTRIGRLVFIHATSVL